MVAVTLCLKDPGWEVSIYVPHFIDPASTFGWPSVSTLKGFGLARLETRTKESTHTRKCMYMMILCIVNATVVIYAATFDLYLRREV